MKSIYKNRFDGIGFFKKNNGAVSVFLVIILVPMLLVSALFIDTARVRLARGAVEAASDTALNSALADYDVDLKDIYGLFATAQDTAEVYDNIEEYFRKSVSAAGIGSEDTEHIVEGLMDSIAGFAESEESDDLLNIEVTDVSLTKRSDLSLASAPVLKREIVEFMKYRSPINTGLGFISSLTSFSTLKQQNDMVNKRKEYYSEQNTVMELAKNAWEYIYKYNQAGFAQDDTYLANMKECFEGCKDTYTDIGKRIVKDLYDTQGYGDFKDHIRDFMEEEIERDGNKEKEYVLYTDNAHTNKKKVYTEYTYSDSHKAPANQVKSRLIKFYEYYETYTKSRELIDTAVPYYNAETYGWQYFVQMNRIDPKPYNTWMTDMEALYDAYSDLKNAVTYAEDDAMSTSAAINGSSSSKTYQEYYTAYIQDAKKAFKEFCWYEGSSREGHFPDITSRLSTCSKSAHADYESTKQEANSRASRIKEYYETVKKAKDNLDGAIAELNQIYTKVKAGGTLDQKKEDWNTAATNESVKNTSMAMQDSAEIAALGKYLNEEDVKKLEDRLQNISNNLGNLIRQLESFRFYNKKIVEINGYDDLEKLIEDNIGADTLKSVPTKKSDLETKVNEWVDNKFTIDEEINFDWIKDPKSNPKLHGTGTDTLNFYKYLYAHFNSATQADGTVKKDEKNGKENYDNMKSDEKDKADEKLKEAKKEDESTKNTKEIKDQKNLPSSGTGGSAAGTENTPTGEDAAKDNSAALDGMFKDLSGSSIGFGTELLEKLYVADYAMSMFSYDTIENELREKYNESNKKNKSEDEKTPKTLTMDVMNKDHNLAYRGEVEYIIYGGSNSGNKLKAYGSIFAIRLGFNLIYAFMTSEIRDTALAIATPISAATLGIVPVPLIQAVIIIGLACAESAIDLADLKAGKKVPLFKTADTWNCSIKGVTKRAKAAVGDALKDVVNDGTNAAANKLNEYLDMADDELTEAINSGEKEFNASIDKAFDQMINQNVETAVQQLTTACNKAVEEAKTNMDEVFDVDKWTKYVNEKMDTWLESQDEDHDSIAYQAKEEAVSLIKNNYSKGMLQQIKDTTINGMNVAIDKTEAFIGENARKITDYTDKIRTKIKNEVTTGTEKIKQKKDEIKKKISNSISEGAGKVKESINSGIDSIFGGNSGDKDTHMGVSSLLSFRYSDYLRLFLIIGLLSGSGEEATLLRIADVIQVNMAHRLNKKDYDLRNAATYVSISSTVQVKPTVLAVPLFSKVEGNPAHKEGWYTLNYSAVRGY